MISPLVDLEVHAGERPNDIALTSPARKYTYAELLLAVDASAIRLRDLGIRPRDLVAIELPSALEWILDLALMRLAARSVSIRGVRDAGPLAPDVVIAEVGYGGVPAPLTLAVDDLWIAGALSRASGPPPAVEYPRTDSIFRLMLTSGTTGVPRAAAYSIGALGFRGDGLHRYWTDDRSELNLMGLSTTGGFHSAVAALRHGGTFLAVDRIDAEVLRFAADERVQVLCGSPVQIATALEVMRVNDITLPTLEEVRMAGAAPSARLMRIIADRLGVAVRGVYGSTEGGGVTTRMLRLDDDLADVGAALPGLELQIVDDSGKPVPPGVEGKVRYRGPGMVSGYLDGGGVKPFARGWFEPGDVGMLDPNGSLVLSGRAAEVLNIAGMKVNPAIVDDLAAVFPGVIDAATFGLERETGIAELGLAVVARPDCDLRALDQDLRRRLRTGHPTTFWRVAEIPRNRMGKVERGLLADAYERAHGAR
ncbi:MAG: class I adenylate-forming enzyme family protein [Rhodoglobus sp.]